MSTFAVRVLLGTSLAGCASGCTPTRPLPTKGGPDVVIITVDTLRADRLGYAGHAPATTPVLDALAARSRVFSDATTPLTRTTPALASLWAGTDPRGHGSWEVGAPIHASAPLLSERLHEAGWATIAVSASPVAAPKQGLGRGFDHFTVLEDPPAAEVAAVALEAVATVDDARPLLLWVHLTDPHFPYRVPGGHPAAGQTPLCDALGERFTKRPKKRWQVFADHNGRSSAALADCQRAYDAEVTAVDTAVGTLLEGLGQRAGGFVVVTSDHGENQGEGGLWYEHGPDAHDATLRVPLLIAGPGLPLGTDNQPARLQDIAPTILRRLELPGLHGTGAGTDLLGTERPTAAVGVSASALHPGLTRYLRSGRAHKRHCLNSVADGISWCSDGAFDHRMDPSLRTAAELPAPLTTALAAAADTWPPEQARQWVARTDTWKLVAEPVLAGGFDLRLVPTTDEAAADQSAAHPEVRAALEAALRAATVGAAVPGPGSTGSSTGTLSPEDDAALRTLGYIE